MTMTGIPDSRGPTYISSHSADVILSEVRPIKLQADALRSINVLLDEVLYNILAAARSLSTEKLRAGLLKVLPTSLGKDALLEAEVELRAYKDRTSSFYSDNMQNGDDQRNFHLQWAFELLRLKCEAYCTLNESDEDPEAEMRLQNRMGQAGGLAPPKAALVAPASLYLTAILEALCEHILSNVARVAARDSSKTSATIQDIFVALCEDNSIYALFRQLKVYEQIETYSMASKSRRSQSLSVGGRTSNSDLVSSKGSGSQQHNSRVSLDSTGSAMATSTAHVGSRGSSDKRGHNKSDSFRKNERQSVSPSSMVRPNEDAALLQEFDNLMLSDSTMKVSLTPDRLKSMDTFNKERGQRSGTAGSKVESDRRIAGRQSSLRTVDLIAEVEEESPAKTPSRNRTASTAGTSTASPKLFRTRSSSASHPPSAIRNIVKKSSRPDVNGSTPPTPVTRERQSSQAADTLPTHNPKALSPLKPVDLTGDMQTSDDEEVQANGQKPSPVPRTPLTVSSKTRELIDFLSEGPPDNVGADLRVSASAVSLESGKSRSGRLQRMISKLSMGNSGDKQPSRSNSDTLKKSKSSTSTSPPLVLVNKPILPRPPPPVRPPSLSSQESFVDVHPLVHSRNAQSGSPTTKRITTAPVSNSPPIGLRKDEQAKQGTDKNQVESSKEETYSPSAAAPVPPMKTSDTPVKTVCDICASQKALARTTTALSTTETKRASAAALSLQLARDIQRRMSIATTAEECRLLFDIFLAKSGIPMESTNDDLPYPSPAPSLFPSTSSSADSDVENLLAEHLLNSDASTDASSVVDGEIDKAGPTYSSIPPQDSFKPDIDATSCTQTTNDTLSASPTR